MNSIVYVGEHSRTYDVQWHTHEEWELVYCTGGGGVFHFENGSTMTYDKGDVVAVPPMSGVRTFRSTSISSMISMSRFPQSSCPK